jgi:GDP-mannose 6-dehydrogenase
VKIVIFGLGYVGLTSAVCLSELGHSVVGVEVNAQKADLVNHGTSPISEPGIADLLARQVSAGRLRATGDGTGALADADAAFICVGTPSNIHGAIDDSHLRNVVADIARARKKFARFIPIFVRSTALPAAHRLAMQIIADIVPGAPLLYCVHPEFLRAGQALADFRNPPKIVFGMSDASLRDAAEGLYPGITAPITFTDPMTAALVKYADNIFHAVKVTYTNEMSMFAKANDVDARQVLDLVCQDTKLNISAYYMRPGFAFGGSCLPKDLRAALAWSRQNMLSLPMLEHILPSNQLQIDRVVSRILASTAPAVGMFGLAFKADTDDLRESPLVTVAETLHGKGRTMRIYDPPLRVERIIGQNKMFALQVLPHLADLMVEKAEELVRNSDLVVVARSFPGLDWQSLPWHSSQAVLNLDSRTDLSNIEAPVEGIYWR